MLLSYVRSMDKRLRALLISGALLAVPFIGQLLAASGKNPSGGLGNLALFFRFSAIFIVPTALILSAAVIASTPPNLAHRRLELGLSGVIVLLGLEITWFFFAA